jgi:hypothetical protein
LTTNLDKKGAEAGMPLLLLSVILSMLVAGLVWLVIGSQLPLGDQEKLPALNNIAYYALIALVPIFLTIFYIF